MKTALLTLCVLGALGCSLAQQVDLSSCATGQWLGCAASIGKTIFGLHRWGDNNKISIGPYACVGNFKGRISKWKWVWDGKFKCPTLANVEGTSSGYKSRNGAIEHAIEDLMNKLKAGNYLTPAQWTTIMAAMKIKG